MYRIKVNPLKIRDEDGTMKDVGAFFGVEKGKDGKSAYQYAQEGGYTGTEEEFAAKMAAEHPTQEEFDNISEDVNLLMNEIQIERTSTSVKTNIYADGLMTEWKSVNINNGEVNDSSRSVCTDDFVPISLDAIIFNSDTSSGGFTILNIAYYDKDYTFISGEELRFDNSDELVQYDGMWGVQAKFVPQNVAYMKASGQLEILEIGGVYIETTLYKSSVKIPNLDITNGSEVAW